MEASIAATLAASQAAFDAVHVQHSQGSLLGGVPCLPPASAPAPLPRGYGGMQRHLLAMPSHPAAQPNVDTALISESMAWEARWHMTLKNAPVLDTDLVLAGRQLKQYLIPGPSQATAAFVERLEQVVRRCDLPLHSWHLCSEGHCLDKQARSHTISA